MSSLLCFILSAAMLGASVDDLKALDRTTVGDNVFEIVAAIKPLDQDRVLEAIRDWHPDRRYPELGAHGDVFVMLVERAADEPLESSRVLSYVRSFSRPIFGGSGLMARIATRRSEEGPRLPWWIVVSQIPSLSAHIFLMPPPEEGVPFVTLDDRDFWTKIEQSEITPPFGSFGIELASGCDLSSFEFVTLEDRGIFFGSEKDASACGPVTIEFDLEDGRSYFLLRTDSLAETSESIHEEGSGPGGEP